MALKLYRRSTLSGMVGLGIVTGMVVAVLLTPLIAPYGQGEIVGEVWGSASASSPLGLDHLGRDMLTRLLYGGRITLLIAFLATAVAFVLGMSLGLTAAITGGWMDTVLARAVDAVMAIPTLIFALVLLSVLGTSIPVLIGTIAALSSTRVFRLARAIGANIAAMDYVEAARLRGERFLWLAAFEVLPNALPPLIAEFGLRLCANFLFVAALSFLGLGIQPPLADWGGMVRENAAAVSFGGLAPLLPAGAIALFAIGVNLVTDWILAEYVRQQE